MQAAGANARRGQRQIQPFVLQAEVQSLGCEGALLCFKRTLDGLFGRVERLARDLTLRGRQLADVELRERSLAAQHVHAHLFQRVLILRLLDPLQRGRLQFLDLFFDHYSLAGCAYSSSSSTMA